MSTDTIVYLVEDEPFAGTLGDYARAYVAAYYANILDSISNVVWTFENGKPIAHEVKIVNLGKSDDYATFMVMVNAIGTATAKLDLRV